MPKIVDLPAASALTGAEIIPVDQGGTTVQTTAQDIADLSVAAVGTLLRTNNLSDLSDAATARANLGLGTAATQASTAFDAAGDAAAAQAAAIAASDPVGSAASAQAAAIATSAQRASNLSDLASAATARSNLGLGGAATLNVGTSAGTVAAGDDARFAAVAPFITGEVRMFCVGVPTGWLECDGSAVSRATYSALFTAVGTTFGAGNGSTTFNVPDMRRRVPVGAGGTGTATLGNALGNTGGAETHTLSTAELAAHTHQEQYSDGSTGVTAATHPSTGGPSTLNTILPGSVTSIGTPVALNTASAGSGTAHNNVQPSIVLRYGIKT